MPKQANQIIGSFVLRNEGDGCLTSKYQHGDSDQTPFTESCKLIGPIVPNHRFLGNYRTVWLEDRNRVVSAELRIISDPVNASQFRFTWLDDAGTTIFEGTGMLFGEFLVGAYWD